MSIILNALRKSEQERKSIQPEQSAAAITVTPIKPAPVRKVSNMALIFGLLNLLAFAYLFFKLGQPLQTAPALSDASPLLERRLEQTKTVSAVSTLPVSPSTTSTKAISDLLAENKRAQQEDVLKTPPPKPKLPIKKKELTAPTEVPVPVEATTETVEDNSELTDTMAGSEKIAELPEDLLEKPVIKPNRRNNVPLLRELSPDFQAKVPLSTINVLAYAEQPDNRFVIIDMVKYKIGQRIKDKINLVDILPESVVLNFEGKAFRLERP
ncbi:MAG: general secretion pathway protein GspB [Methylococcales bacterium]